MQKDSAADCAWLIVPSLVDESEWAEWRGRAGARNDAVLVGIADGTSWTELDPTDPSAWPAVVVASPPWLRKVVREPTPLGDALSQRRAWVHFGNVDSGAILKHGWVARRVAEQLPGFAGSVFPYSSNANRGNECPWDATFNRWRSGASQIDTHALLDAWRHAEHLSAFSGLDALFDRCIRADAGDEADPADAESLNGSPGSIRQQLRATLNWPATRRPVTRARRGRTPHARTFAAFPCPAQDSPPALALQKAGWKLVASPYQATLTVAFVEPPIEINCCFVSRELLPGARVLFVFAPSQGVHRGPCDCAVYDLSAPFALWATRLAAETAPGSIRPTWWHQLRSDDFRGLLAAQLGEALRGDTAWREVLAQAVAAKQMIAGTAYHSHLIACTTANARAVDFVWALDLLARRHAVERHDELAGRSSRPYDPLHKEPKGSLVLQAAADLRESLLARTDEPGSVLVIDDRKDVLQAIDQVAAKLLPGWTFSRAEGIESWLEDLRRYETLRPMKEGGREFLRVLLKERRFVLVDQLFKTPGSEDFAGPEVIRGLSRFLRDYSSELGIPPAEILAFSRSTEIDLVQEALRSGARDYLPKDRLLKLRAVLAGVRRGTSQTGRYHGNFRRLTRLPNETVGLLQQLRIPRVECHRLGAAEFADQAPEAWRRLLAAIPKTDLHVHVGSCMSPEFLITASLVGLTAHEQPPPDLRATASFLKGLLEGEGRTFTWNVDLGGAVLPLRLPPRHDDWLEGAAAAIRRRLTAELAHSGRSQEQRSSLRSLLHAELRIRDHLDLDDVSRELDRKSASELALMSVRFREARRGEPLRQDDIVRLYLLALADCDGWHIQSEGRAVSLFDWLSDERWRNLNRRWYASASLRMLADERDPLRIEQTYFGGFQLVRLDDSGQSRLERTIATGLRSRNLIEYLEGCEFSGAEHLRHPLLMRLYAQQALVQFLESGTAYAELRGSTEGYVNERIGFSFRQAITQFLWSFRQAQAVLFDVFAGVDSEPDDRWCAGVLGPRFALETVRARLAGNGFDRRLPPKVNLLLVGKRHKTTRQMIQEAAATAVLRPVAVRAGGPSGKIRTSLEFVEESLRSSDVVGFDLAGMESGNPPGRFSSEFQSLSKLHIPLTIHAGENASAQFVEDAILELGARRIGHGLSLIEDPALLVRVREERIAVELCPVSNHQTSHFSRPDTAGPRRYPLREYLEEGLLVSINTDNPIVSGTDIVREFFEASWAYGAPGLSLWDALRIVRMGYVQSFMSLPERRSMIEIVEQYLFDLFCERTTLKILRDLTAET